MHAGSISGGGGGMGVTSGTPTADCRLEGISHHIDFEYKVIKIFGGWKGHFVSIQNVAAYYSRKRVIIFYACLSVNYDGPEYLTSCSRKYLIDQLKFSMT